MQCLLAISTLLTPIKSGVGGCPGSSAGPMADLLSLKGKKPPSSDHFQESVSSIRNVLLQNLRTLKDPRHQDSRRKKEDLAIFRTKGKKGDFYSREEVGGQGSFLLLPTLFFSPSVLLPSLPSSTLRSYEPGWGRGEAGDTKKEPSWPS